MRIFDNLQVTKLLDILIDIAVLQFGRLDLCYEVICTAKEKRFGVISHIFPGHVLCCLWVVVSNLFIVTLNKFHVSEDFFNAIFP